MENFFDGPNNHRDAKKNENKEPDPTATVV
jgi:hypothetical protein